MAISYYINILSCIVEFFLAIILCLGTFFIGFKLSYYLLKDMDNKLELKNNNIALAILEISYIIVFSIFIMVTITPTMKLIFGKHYNSYNSINVLILAILKTVIFYVISISLSFLIIFCSTKFLLMLSGIIDESKEVKKGNISVSLILSSFMLTITYTLVSPFRLLIDSFFPPVEELKFGLQSHFINISLFLESILKIGILIVSFIYIFFISFFILNKIMKGTKVDKEIRKDNVSVTIIVSSLIFALMFIIKKLVIYLPDKIFLIEDLNMDTILLNMLFYFVVSFLILHIVIILNIFLVINSFRFVYKDINVIREIKLKKISIGLIIGIMIIIFNFFIADGILNFIKIIPFI